ncbi:MAG: hypothetical protein ACOZAM_25775 [Pseudomonadota bacterium]
MNIPESSNPEVTRCERRTVLKLIEQGVDPHHAVELVKTHGTNLETLKAALWVEKNLDGKNDEQPS